MSEILSRTKLKTALNRTGTADDGLIQALVTRLTKYFQSETDRTLFETTGDTVFVRGYGTTVLVLRDGPWTAITSLHVSTAKPRVYDGTTLLAASTDYEFDERLGIVYRTDGGIWPRGPNTIQAVGDHGYAAASFPADLEQAFIEIAAAKIPKLKQLLYHTSGEEKGELSKIEIRNQDVSPDARRTLDRYREELP